MYSSTLILSLFLLIRFLFHPILFWNILVICTWRRYTHSLYCGCVFFAKICLAFPTLIVVYMLSVVKLGGWICLWLISVLQALIGGLKFWTSIMCLHVTVFYKLLIQQTLPAIIVHCFRLLTDVDWIGLVGEYNSAMVDTLYVCFNEKRKWRSWTEAVAEPVIGPSLIGG